LASGGAFAATVSKAVGRPSRACRGSRGPGGDPRNSPCRRQGDQVVAPARRGACCCWLRTTRPPPAGADIEEAPIARWGGVGGPSSSRRARVHGWASRWGEGVRSATLRTIKRRSIVAAGLRPLSPAVAVVGARPDGALACRPLRASRMGEWDARGDARARASWSSSHVVAPGAASSYSSWRCHQAAGAFSLRPSGARSSIR
jgi:hypothetical protein